MTTFSEFKQMVDNYTEYAGDAKRIIDAADKYYGEQLSSLQADNKALNEQLENGANQYAYAIVDNERLREALQKIDAKSYGNTHWEDMQGINDLAKAALQNK